MKAAQVVLILSFSVFKLATSWSCYTCRASIDDEETACRQFNSSAITVVNCDLIYKMINVDCIAGELTDGNETYYFRDCAAYNSTLAVTCNDVKEQYEPQNYTLSSCKVCNSDLCNSGMIPGAFSWVVVLTFVIISARLC